MSLPSIDALTDRELLERVHRRLDEERHEAELDAVLLLEALLVSVAQLDHRLHVDFVERGQDGRGRLRLNEALGDALAQARHRHALLRPLRFEIARRRLRHWPHSVAGRRGAAAGAGSPADWLRGGDDVTLGDPPSSSGALEARSIHGEVGNHLARSRKRRCGTGVDAVRSLVRQRVNRRSGGRCGNRRWRRLPRRRAPARRQRRRCR